MAISASDITKLRYSHIRRKNTKLNIFEPEFAATATIDTITGDYPRGSYPVTSTSVNWTNFGAGYLVRISDSVTGVIKFEGITRLGNDANNVYVAGHVSGDTGLAQEEAYTVTAGDDVTVSRVQIPQTFLGRLGADGTLYKQFDQEFDLADPQTGRPRPQVNFGGDRQYTVSAGGTKTGIVLDASSSFSWLGNSISYEWVLPTGVTITSGVDTDASITVSMDEGVHRIRCRVTDSGIATLPSSQGNRYYYINSDNEPAFSDEYTVENINSFVLTRDGWQAQFTVSASAGGIPTSRLYTGAPVLFSYDIEYSQDGRTWVTTDDEELNRRYYKGYIRRFDSVSYNTEGRIDRVTFTVQSLMIYMDALPIASQVILYDATPTNWQESPYTDINRLMHTIIRYHSDVVTEDNDLSIYADNANYISPIHAVNQGSLSAAMREVVAKRLGCNIGNLSHGQMYTAPHRSYEDSTFRAAQTSQFTFTTQDVFNGQVSFAIDQVMKYQQSNGSFFVADTTGTPVIGIRGLGAPMQGGSINQIPSFVALSKTEGLERIGHDHQNKNRKIQTITLSTFNDGIVEPAALEAFTFDLDSVDAMNTGVLNNTVWLPIEARYNFPDNSMSSVPPRIEIDFEPETEGQPASELIPSNLPAYTWDFTDNDGGWTLGLYGAYVANEGWRTSAFDRLEITANAGAGTVINSITIVVAIPAGADVLQNSWLHNLVRLSLSGSGVYTYGQSSMEADYAMLTVPFANKTLVIDNSTVSDGIEIDEMDVKFEVVTNDLFIRSISITYTGTNSFTGGVDS